MPHDFCYPVSVMTSCPLLTSVILVGYAGGFNFRAARQEHTVRAALKQHSTQGFGVLCCCLILLFVEIMSNIVQAGLKLEILHS